VKNLLALMFLSAGTPMLLMGDEARRTQRGNNNAYCQDNDLSWFDWTLVERHADIHRFVKLLATFRGRRDVVLEKRALSLSELLQRARITWHGVALEHPDWTESSHAIAFAMESVRGTFQLHVMLNAYWEPLHFELPQVGSGPSWRRCMDTAKDSPDDIYPWADAPEVDARVYCAQSRSVVVLARRLAEE
jgi:glycogen operon protein